VSFDFNSMAVKYERFTGNKWKPGSIDNAITPIRKNFPVVSLEGKRELEHSMHMVRDWCQEQFGDDWIYDWNDFYFVRQQDAVMFALRWV
jgi:hypothetical protein